MQQILPLRQKTAAKELKKTGFYQIKIFFEIGTGIA